jgi:hypothetical protein
VVARLFGLCNSYLLWGPQHVPRKDREARAVSRHFSRAVEVADSARGLHNDQNQKIRNGGTAHRWLQHSTAYTSNKHGGATLRRVGPVPQL